MEKAKLKELFISGNMPTGAEYKAALQNVLSAFPYFQLAQVLFAKQMYDTNEPEASTRIRLASVYAPDRKAMYVLFKKPNDKAEEVKPLDAGDLKAHEKVEVNYNFVYSSTVTENKAIADIPAKKEIKLPSLREELVREETETKLPPMKAPFKEVEKAPEKQPEPKSQLIADKPKIHPEPGQIVKGGGEETALVAEPVKAGKLKYTFSSWLKVLPETNAEKKEDKKPVGANEMVNIIDRFLKDEPKISRPKASFFSPVKAAKQSVAEDDTLVSETLAEIYIRQGNLPKALKAYQALLIQFPEKKNIFAPRIEKIKSLIRENTKPGTK